MGWSVGTIRHGELIEYPRLIRRKKPYMHFYSTLADEYYTNMHLNTEMPLPTARETVLDFFGRTQKTYPSMRNFYTRENGDFVLEEDKDRESHRWLSLEPRRICSSQVNPPTPDEAFEQHSLILQLVPYMLSVSPLDCEALDYMIGFDFTYRGNHDALVAEALGVAPSMDSLIDIPNAQPLNYEPQVTLSLTEDCRLQARLMIETRTNAYQVKRGDFPEEQLSVFFTVRQYGSLLSEASFEEELHHLRIKSEELLEAHVVEQVLKPLAQTISRK
ncbi:MAG: hypothetical protein P8M30_10330 [Planctomycetaceae bacterium]|mgnify:CR=1 FL=1|nr:hypothetical protein [Planctomycetaceae bacterium]MDG2389703.1 hypothetical protein [Planctomycetaceae bacterium]